jgi:hypothetical protein
VLFFWYLSRNFKDKIFIRRGGVSSLVERVNLGFGSLRILEGQFGPLDRPMLGLASIRCYL